MSAKSFGIRDVRTNTSGVYYTLTVRTKGSLSATATVTVKHTKFDTFACLTCTNVSCEHAKFVQLHVEGEPAEVPA